ncbi:hypothetical protein BLS_007248 [Venturia inaequalis]|uniref:Small nuclear ribonucleoprotein Prp3 C-terminal domain-containing protein n=1 Tax=Venturia inaequalis TaxID=5025 RepID=A0A8H3UDR9_VENIN|nr:hypothetical protein EG328_008588 [Venturia inaequalis]KAE9981556.1 hypothetical protein BLS_007248 [Venturia inaequalis]
MSQNGISTLSAEHIEAQLSTIQLLAGMFPEASIPPETLRWTSSSEDPLPSSTPSELFLSLNLNVGDVACAEVRHILLNISVPLRYSDLDRAEPPPLRYHLRQPEWLSRAQILEFASAMPQGDVFEAIEWIREEAPERLVAKMEEDSSTSGRAVEALVRVWFYFPSLSTREKRDDMVNFAPAYQLTGFVLAGKPGVLCLEGTTTNIDTYMRYIKTHSWGDIPSHQKKVSERYRETLGKDGDSNCVRRVFSRMEEITGGLGDRGGARANRGDMRALEIWLKERGLGEAFEKVIF